MKIAYLMPEIACSTGRCNGIRVQAETWALGLREMGVSVDLLGPWDNYDFKSCDLIHYFSYHARLSDDCVAMKRKFGLPFVVSPIIDTNRATGLSWIASRVELPQIHIYSLSGALRRCANIVDGWFVRSDYEGNYIHSAFSAPRERIFKVMLPARLSGGDFCNSRESFCLLVCHMPDPRKNVFRLIEAALKYDFKLVLAGKCCDIRLYEKMLRMVRGHDNIVVKGFVSDEELKSLYSRARVFALPSLMEGVGLVALEAASYGCDVVITKRGGPKEYYDGMAEIVDPLSVDEIGIAVRHFLTGKTFQPRLKKHIEENHSLQASARSLLSAYNDILGRNRR